MNYSQSLVSTATVSLSSNRSVLLAPHRLDRLLVEMQFLLAAGHAPEPKHLHCIQRTQNVYQV